jgi:tRNA pseudouridine55 synthase
VSCLPEEHSRTLGGVVFLDKPQGWTSRRAVNEVARLFGGIKAGHAGTLDPLATGMLPILLGEATRFAGYGLDADKAYEVDIDLSLQTDTLDAEGEMTARFDAPPERADVEEAVAAFRGEYAQYPPAFSAIRVDGKRAHQLARQGAEVALASRQVHIHELRLLDWRWPHLRLFVRCSKGTYIRSLARDIGERLHLGGCVAELRRLSTGNWPPEMMVDIDTLRERGEQAIMPLGGWLRHLPTVSLEAAEARRFVQGQRIPVALPDEPAADIVVYCGELLLGTASVKEGTVASQVLHPKRILPSAQQALG